MRCRKIHFERNGGNILSRTIVWFGSYGLTQDGKAKFYSEDKSSYSVGTQAVSDSLMQRLNVLQGELWYNVNEGIPLWDNHRNTLVLDTYITSTILKHPDVVSITEFNSKITKVEKENYSMYSANIKIASKYGSVDINISQNIS